MSYFSLHMHSWEICRNVLQFSYISNGTFNPYLSTSLSISNLANIPSKFQLLLSLTKPSWSFISTYCYVSLIALCLNTSTHSVAYIFLASQLSVYLSARHHTYIISYSIIIFLLSLTTASLHSIMPKFDYHKVDGEIISNCYLPVSYSLSVLYNKYESNVNYESSSPEKNYV